MYKNDLSGLGYFTLTYLVHAKAAIAVIAVIAYIRNLKFSHAFVHKFIRPFLHSYI